MRRRVWFRLFSALAAAWSFSRGIGTYRSFATGVAATQLRRRTRRSRWLFEEHSSRIAVTDCSSDHILVVDDDPAVRHLISDYFGEHGIQTVSATGRSAAAGQLAGEDPSAIILELRLGQGNGLDLLREIHSSSDVPVIFLTGRYGDKVDCMG